MRHPLTISLYIAKQFLLGVLLVITALSVLILILDALEIIRRLYDRSVPGLVIAQMVLMKYPLTLQKLLPFAILFGSVLSLSKLSRNHELIILRSSGMSVWEFLMPALCSALLLGLLFTTVINPVACVMIARYELLEGRYLHGRSSLLSVSETGLWLKQKNVPPKDVAVDEDAPSIDYGETVLHALKASGEQELHLKEVIIFVFGKDNKFLSRIDAKEATLVSEFWQLKGVQIMNGEGLEETFDEYFLETTLTSDEIQNSFAAPESISFWALPAFIETIKQAGFSALEHQLYWHNLLTSPLLFASMVLIAAMFSLKPPRLSKQGLLISGSIVTGFLIYFFTNVISSLGLSGSIPVVISAWVPVGVSLLIGTGFLLHLEEG